MFTPETKLTKCVCGPYLDPEKNKLILQKHFLRQQEKFEHGLGMM